MTTCNDNQDLQIKYCMSKDSYIFKSTSSNPCFHKQQNISPKPKHKSSDAKLFEAAQDYHSSDAKLFEAAQDCDSSDVKLSEATQDCTLSTVFSPIPEKNQPQYNHIYHHVQSLVNNFIIVDDHIWIKSIDNEYFFMISSAKELQSYVIEKICLLTGYEFEEIVQVFNNKIINGIYNNMIIDYRAKNRATQLKPVDNYLPLLTQIVKVYNGNIEMLNYNQANALFKTQINSNISSSHGGYFEKFLDGFLGDNDSNSRDRFWELMGNLLFSNQDAKVLCCLYGKGNDGKSTLIRFLQKLFLTPDAVCSSDMKTAFSTHGSASFENANIVVLQESNDIIKQAHADMIKRLTGGDGITINPKHRNMKPKNIKIKLLMVCNHPLRFAEGVIDDALKSRFEFIQVYSVPSEQRNPNLLYDLLSESDYFIQKSIEGFARLQKNNYRFTESKKDSDLKESIFCNDPAQDFIDMCCDICPNGFLETNSFNKAYNHWSKTYPDHITKKELKTGIINKGYLHKRQRTNNSQPYGFVGLKLKSLI